MRLISAAVTVALAIAAPACLAANARNPYGNINPADDAGNDTGDLQVEALNQAQIDDGPVPAIRNAPSYPREADPYAGQQREAPYGYAPPGGNYPEDGYAPPPAAYPPPPPYQPARAYAPPGYVPYRPAPGYPPPGYAPPYYGPGPSASPGYYPSPAYYPPPGYAPPPGY